MSQFIVRLLGPPTVEWEGAFLSIPRRKVRALLYRLALESVPVARAHLATLFCDNRPDAVAHRDLSHLVTHLRDALPLPGLVQCTSDFLFLDPRVTWSDTAELLRVLRRYHAAPTQALLIDAAALVHGELLDGFTLNDCPEFEEWLTVERSVWERRHLAVMDALERADAMPNNGAMALLRAPTLDEVALDPQLHRSLVQARMERGEEDAVQRHWVACRDLFTTFLHALA